uniref:Zinc finger, CCHC-type, retrotransposon Gag domain protein n=1 Tax=Tanacetum cinerariifolium TaxID=118510 RepID=A0A699JG27_TANCI|nr:zinc finger, CCHC-type, retrotransposon Gag domain protein [Tanacetum cinerariifolium]
MNSVRMVPREMVTNLLPSILGWKGLESRSLDPLAPQPLQLMLKTRLLILRSCLRFWHVANAGRNIKLLRERGGSNNKRNRDGDRIQPAARNNNQKGYDQRRSDGRGYDRQNNNQRDFGQRGNDGRSYDTHGGNSGQKSYRQN